MKLAIQNLLKSGLLLGLVSVGAYACGQSNGGGNGTGGSPPEGSGGTSDGGHPGSGGATSSGGTTASGGTTGSGGAQETGGTVGTGGSNSGGTKSTGGSSSGGAMTGGSSAGGAGGTSSSSTAMGGTGGMLSGGAGGKTSGTGGTAPGTGGMAPGTGGAGSGGKGGTGGPTDGGPAAGGAGGTSSGACQKGQIKPAEVVIMGESFYAIAPQYIETRIESDAQTAGALASGAKYRNVAVSGQNMNYIATTEWTAATQGGASVKNVIMDGGGIDCLTGGGGACTTCPDTFKTLLGKMVTAGVQDVIYTRYPEPGSPPGSNASLKSCLDATMPNMQTVCQGVSGLRCHWVDLRPVWQTNDVLTDGLHPTQSGGNHVGDLVWSEMVKDCMAQ